MLHHLKNLGLLPLSLLVLALAPAQATGAGPDYAGAMEACRAEEKHGASACEASFLFTFLDDSTALFYNSSSGYSGYEWLANGEVITPAGGALAFTHTFTSDTNLVCLLVWDGAGCQDFKCLTVYPGAPEEMCNVTDCVWPGDANGDGRANNYDLLNIGLGFGIPGPQRPFFPDTTNSISWLPNYGADWQDWVGAVNFKHLDCDGDGFIDEMDVDAIAINYAPDLDFTSIPVATGPEVYLEFEEPEVYVTENSPPYIELNAGLYVGSETTPVSGLHGMALYLTYPNGLTVSDSITIDYDGASFFGDDYEVLEIGRGLDDYNLGRYDLAFSRKNDGGVTGYGRVARLSFIVSADIIEGIAVADTPYTVGIGGVALIDSIGVPLDFSSPGSATATIINTVTAEDKDALVQEAEIKIFPNPASTSISLQFASRPPEWIELANAFGQVVLRRPASGPSMEIDISALKPGLYVLNAYSQEGVASRKVLVESGEVR